MKRKLIQMGGRTMVVSLPSPWVKKYNLKKGDEIDLEEKGKNLILGFETKKEIKGQEITIHIPSSDLFMERSLHVWYRRGYDKIIITFDEKDVLRKIKVTIKKLLGFEIINESDKSCIIKAVATGMEEEFDNILRRIFLSLLTTAKESHESIKKQNYKNLNDVLIAEENNNIQCFFCERILAKKGYKEPEKIPLLYFAVWTLEQIADEYKKIAHRIMDTKKKSKVNKKTLEIYSNTIKNLEMIYHLFYKSTLKDFKEQKVHLKNLKKDSFTYFSEAISINKIILHHLMIIQDKLAQMSILLT